MKTKINWSIVQMTLTMIIGNIISMIVYSIILKFTGEGRIAEALTLILIALVLIFAALDLCGILFVAGPSAIAAFVLFIGLLFFCLDYSAAFTNLDFNLAIAFTLTLVSSIAFAYTFAESFFERRGTRFNIRKIFLFSIVLIGILGIGDFFFIKQTSLGISICIIIVSVIIALISPVLDIMRQKKGTSIFVKY